MFLNHSALVEDRWHVYQMNFKVVRQTGGSALKSLISFAKYQIVCYNYDSLILIKCKPMDVSSYIFVKPWTIKDFIHRESNLF